MRKRYVYYHYDADDRLLYIGCTVNVTARMYRHKHAEWWPLSVRMETVECANKEIGFEYERREIQRLNPAFNHQHRLERNFMPYVRPVADHPTRAEFDLGRFHQQYHAAETPEERRSLLRSIGLPEEFWQPWDRVA